MVDPGSAALATDFQLLRSLAPVQTRVPARGRRSGSSPSAWPHPRLGTNSLLGRLIPNGELLRDIFRAVLRER